MHLLARAVFLDRDGTLNRAFIRDGVSHPPSAVSDLEILPGVDESLDLLKAAGFLLVVVTNQPDVARGSLSRVVAEQINAALRKRLPQIDALMCCYHDDADRCTCRKPQPGMLVEAASRLRVDVSASFMLGDSWRDCEAGRRAGCRTILVGAGALVSSHSRMPDYTANTMPEAVRIVLQAAREEDRL